MRYLKVTVAKLDRQALLASGSHGRTVGVDGDGGVSPAFAVKFLVLENLVLLLANPFRRRAVVVSADEASRHSKDGQCMAQRHLLVG